MLGYDGLGRLDDVTIQPANETYDLVYDPDTGLLDTSDTPLSAISLGFAYTGSRLVEETTAGAFTSDATVSWNLDGDGRLDDRTVGAGPVIDFDYDGDGLLVLAGAETLVPDPTTGLLATTTLGSIGTTIDYNDFGEPENDSASFNATPLYSNVYTRDQIGRIAQKTEIVDGGLATTYTYDYDYAGRLREVVTTGSASSTVTYAYDDNGNRLSRTVLGGTPEIATHDDQDRLDDYGDLTFLYNDNGDLESKTDTVLLETTQYVYDARGNLRSVTLPDTTVISYEVDARDRRVVKQVGGTFELGLVYGDALNPVAEVDASGAVVSRFVYGSRSNVPDYMTRGGETYRILSDHLGSVRLVVNSTTGVIAQRIDYDEFGNVTTDSNAGFQPFGFAGGIYDPDTELVRFGARDYDPRVGRWTTKDPIRFDSSGTNLYGYALNDPVNLFDPTGLDTLVADRPAGRLTLRDNAGNTVASYPVGNNTVNPTGDPNTVGSNGPAPSGTFPVQDPVNTGSSVSYGPIFIPIGAVGPNGEREDIARQRGIGIHGGRAGPQSATEGCLRVSDDTARDLARRHAQSPITEITIR